VRQRNAMMTALRMSNTEETLVKSTQPGRALSVSSHGPEMSREEQPSTLRRTRTLNENPPSAFGGERHLSVPKKGYRAPFVTCYGAVPRPRCWVMPRKPQTPKNVLDWPKAGLLARNGAVAASYQSHFAGGTRKRYPDSFSRKRWVIP
jgi:hypothetical protein